MKGLKRRLRIYSVYGLISCLSVFVLLFSLQSHSETINTSIECHRLLGQVEKAVKADPEVLPTDWVYLMTHDGKLVSSHYLKNITRSTLEVFGRWFKGQSQESFEAMLRSQHQKTIYGENSSENYLSRTSTFKSPEDLAPGTLRSDSAYPFHDNIEKIKLEEEMLEHSMFPKTLIAQMKVGSDVGFSTPIKGVPAFAWTKRLRMTFEKYEDEKTFREKKRFTWTHGYSSPMFIPIYIKAMSKVMSQIQALPKKPENRIELINLLAEYHQLFINALPFRRVNNSIAMSHVNYILLSWGMKGISHGHLDLICLVTSTEQYQNYFYRAVKSENPELP